MRKESLFEKKPKESKFKILLKGFLLLALLGFLTLAGLFIFYAKDLPNPGKINKRVVAESTKIYDRTGEVLLYEIHGEEKRTVIPAMEIPDTVKSATIALEDQGFYQHYGVDIRAVLRAGLKDILKGNKAEGGSTITQQFVKNSILTNEKSLSRKIKELILSLEIEQKFSKDEILGMYLNEIPYGSNAYGIEAAAQTFFAKSARELSLAQSALIASLPKAPTFFSPYGSHTDRLLVRWQYALNQMASLGYISQEQANNAKAEDILSQIKPFRADMKAPHFSLFVKEQLVKEFGEDVETRGLKVYTTLDWDLQKLAEKSVKEGVEKNGFKYKFNNSALVAQNPKTGQILAMVGSKDYFDESIDGQVNVALRLRQPGSSFKPYAYAKAFEKGFTPETILMDVDIDFATEEGKSYNPKNYDDKNRGPVKMKEALPMSLNVPAVETLYLAGIKDTIELARAMGITTLNKPNQYGLALVLGGGEVKLIDHIAAYSTIANDGFHVGQTSILRVEDSAGNVLKNYEQKSGQQALDKNVARIMQDIMSNNDLRAPVFGNQNSLVIPDRQVMAKTGTTNEWRDGWLMGATPSLASGVWAGNNNNSAMAQGADGSYVAGPIWNDFMREALKNMKKEEFTKPEERILTGKPILDGEMKMEEKVEVCKYDSNKYCLASDACPDGKKDKKRFYVTHSILYYIDKDDPRGDAPRDPKKDSQFNNWEKAVKAWAKKESDKDSLPEFPDRKCNEDDF